MQFTPQQLAGGRSFSSVTRIGNWREEIALSESKLKEFRSNSSGGSLHLRKQQQKLAKCLQLVNYFNLLLEIFLHFFFLDFSLSFLTSFFLLGTT